jgi:hypothetical protein
MYFIPILKTSHKEKTRQQEPVSVALPMHEGNPDTTINLFSVFFLPIPSFQPTQIVLLDNREGNLLRIVTLEVVPVLIQSLFYI